MGSYHVEWPCCGDTTITECWEPEDCPFCEAAKVAVLVEALRDAESQLVAAQWNSRDAAKTDKRWVGVADEIQPTVDRIRALLAKHKEQQP